MASRKGSATSAHPPRSSATTRAVWRSIEREARVRYRSRLSGSKRLAASAPGDPTALATDRARRCAHSRAPWKCRGWTRRCSAIKELGAQKRCTLFSTLMALYAVSVAPADRPAGPDHRHPRRRPADDGRPGSGGPLRESPAAAPAHRSRRSRSPRIPRRGATRPCWMPTSIKGMTFGALLEGVAIAARSDAFAADPSDVQCGSGDPRHCSSRTSRRKSSSTRAPPTSSSTPSTSWRYPDRLRIECNYNYRPLSARRPSCAGSSHYRHHRARRGRATRIQPIV
jgi:hypothetical protein